MDGLYQRLHERDSLSEDDKKKLQQELTTIKNNWHNLEELIHETHAKYVLMMSFFSEVPLQLRKAVSRIPLVMTLILDFSVPWI